MRRWHLVGLHALAYVVLLGLFVFFVSEPLVTLCFPDHHSLELWFQVVAAGAVLLFLLCALSLVFFWRRQALR